MHGAACRDVLEYARVGPPVMFVVDGMNISSHSPDIDAVSGCATCNTDSLVSLVAQAAQHPVTSHIASPAASWIDDFLAWIQPELPNCCRTHTNGAHEGVWPFVLFLVALADGTVPGHAHDGMPCRITSPLSAKRYVQYRYPVNPQLFGVAGAFCPAPNVPPCGALHDPCADCNTCLRVEDLDKGRPSTEDTIKLLPGFLQAKPSKQCAKGGLGVYSALFEVDAADGLPVGLRNATVTSAFRALSAPLSKQHDFVSALLTGRQIVDSAQAALDAAHRGACLT